MSQIKEKNSIVDKWGERSSSLGWVAIPTLLLFAQKDLRITPSEMNVLLNLLSHWWEKSKKPFPSQGAIAYRTGMSLKTVQRTLSSLEKKGLIIKTHTSRANKMTQGRNFYDLMPLVIKLDKVSSGIIDEMESRKRELIKNEH